MRKGGYLIGRWRWLEVVVSRDGEMLLAERATYLRGGLEVAVGRVWFVW